MIRRGEGGEAGFSANVFSYLSCPRDLFVSRLSPSSSPARLWVTVHDGNDLHEQPILLPASFSLIIWIPDLLLVSSLLFHCMHQRGRKKRSYTDTHIAVRVYAQPPSLFASFSLLSPSFLCLVNANFEQKPPMRTRDMIQKVQ